MKKARENAGQATRIIPSKSFGRAFGSTCVRKCKDRFVICIETNMTLIFTDIEVKRLGGTIRARRLALEPAPLKQKKKNHEYVYIPGIEQKETNLTPQHAVSTHC